MDVRYRTVGVETIEARRDMKTAHVPVIGIPQKPSLALISSTSATVSLGPRTTGSVMNPFS
jgi:hypothetical protein